MKGRWLKIFLLPLLLSVFAGAALAGYRIMVLQTVEVNCARWHYGKLVTTSCENPKAKLRAEQILKRQRGGSLLNLDLPDLSEKINNISGISSVLSRRRLPDFLEVTLVMHNPLAVWAGGGLVDMLGEHYEGESLEVLPVFKGASKRLAEQMTEFYDFAQKILHPAGIAQLQLDSNGSWMIFLQDGVLLYLGETPKRKLRRYAKHKESLADNFTAVRAVDLRYSRGFSVDGDLRDGEVI